MKKSECIGAAIACCVSGLVGAIIANGFADKWWSTRLFIKERELQEKTEKADALVKSVEEQADKAMKNLAEQVDAAVRFVYENGAQIAFEKRLKTINIEMIAENLCRSEIHKCEDTVITRIIRDEYSGQIRQVMQNELKEYFKKGIKEMVDVDIDADFIRRIAKQYVKDNAIDILEDEIKKAVRNYNVAGRVEDIIEDCDLDDAVEEYINSHPSKLQEAIRKSVNTILKDKLDDDFIDRVIEAMEEAE